MKIILAVKSLYFRVHVIISRKTEYNRIERIENVNIHWIVVESRFYRNYGEKFKSVKN